jgi:hypothetical protein
MADIIHRCGSQGACFAGVCGMSDGGRHGRLVNKDTSARFVFILVEKKVGPRTLKHTFP